MNKAQILQQRLADNRSQKVIYLSQCILNENVRYLGGAFRKGGLREIVEGCWDKGWSIVQMPCPEQCAWGGVTKRWLLMLYGTKGTFLYRMRRMVLPILTLYTKLRLRRLAKVIAGQIHDYRVSGYTVIGIIGIDGSPSCGVNTTMDLERSFELMASIDVNSISVGQMTDILLQGSTAGRGLFASALRLELDRRHIDVPFVAHDVLDEVNGKSSKVISQLS